MKILFVANGFPPSGQWGTEFYTHQAATGLAAQGHSVSVLCPQREGHGERFSVKTTTRYGLTLHEVSNPPTHAKRFRDSYLSEGVERCFDELLREHKPDVVHFTHFLWGLSARLPVLARDSGAKVLATLTDFGISCHRGQFLDAHLDPCDGGNPEKCARCVRTLGKYDGPQPWRGVKQVLASAMAKVGGMGLVPTAEDLKKRGEILQAAIEATDLFIAPTEAIATRLRGDVIPAEKLEVLCYGIDERPFNDAPSSHGGDTLRFGFLGQFQPHKGLDTIFRAVRRLEDDATYRDRKWSVRVHGTRVGGRHARFIARTWDPRLATRFEFQGPFEPMQAPWAMAELDAVIVPSCWTENAPLTVLQAMAMGLPMIVSDVPGIREVVPPGTPMISPGDGAALSVAMGKMIREGVRRELQPGVLPVPYGDHIKALLGQYGHLLEHRPGLRLVSGD